MSAAEEFAGGRRPLVKGLVVLVPAGRRFLCKTLGPKAPVDVEKFPGDETCLF